MEHGKSMVHLALQSARYKACLRPHDPFLMPSDESTFVGGAHTAMRVDPAGLNTNASTGNSGSKLKARAAREIRRFVVMFLDLWVLLGFFVINERIILAQRGVFVSAQGFALVNALVLAKVMLVAEDLNLDRWLRSRPLNFIILYESFLLTVLFICFHVAERTISGLLMGKSVEASVPAIGGGGLVGLVCVAVILFVALIPFFAFKHVGRALGEGRLHAMLFTVPSRDAGSNRVA